MNRTYFQRLSVLVVLILSVTPACVRQSRNATNVAKPAPESSTTPAQTSTATTVSYKGVTFTFDRSLASEVKTETVPASLEGKPSDIWPEHPGFTLVGYPKPKSMSESDPHIRVFSVAKFREAFSVAGKEFAKSNPKEGGNWAGDFDEEVNVLKKVLATQPKQDQLSTLIGSKQSECYGVAQIPFLPMWEACQPFAAQVRYVDFKNGKGIFFLTQWDTETSEVTNSGLEYAFQGITNDGRYWVYAEFSVSAPGLPKGDEPEVVAWNNKNYLLSYKTKQYQDYLRPVVAKVEGLRASDFRPNLDLLEQLIQSLDVKDNQ